MKKFLTVFLTVVMAAACLFAFGACGNDKKPDDSGNGDNKAEYVKDIHGRFRNTDSKGATYEFYIDSGNKFHLYGTLKHSDNTESYFEFEGQVTDMNIDQMYVQCAQVMFFNYKYHGVAYKPADSGASQVTKDYKNAWMDDHGTNEYKVYLVRTSNDTSDNGNAGTFTAEEGWDLAEGLWEFTPTKGQITE